MVDRLDPSIFRMPIAYNARKIFRDGYHHMTLGSGNRQLRLPERALVGWIVRLCNLPKYLQRVQLRVRMSRSGAACCRINDGYALHSPATGEIPGLRQALQACDEKIATYLEVRAGRSAPSGYFDPAVYAKEMSKTDDDPLKHVPYRYDQAAAAALIRPFLSPPVYMTAAQYLGLLPVLGGVRILYSPNEPSDELIRAQLFHTDPEGARQVKVFIPVQDVGPENSPFTFIPEARSRRLRASGPQMARKRLPDKAVLKREPRAGWIAHQGRRGDVLFVDTSRCLHFGSRPNRKPRLLLYAQYLDPFCSVFPATRAGGQIARTYGFYKTDDPIEQYLLGRR